MLLHEYLAYVRDTFGAIPEYLWARSPDSFALRHTDSRKWFACGMRVSGTVLHLDTPEVRDIVDLKADPMTIGSVRCEPGVLPGYHMNKAHWITVLLDGTADDALIRALTEDSFRITRAKTK
ncbi:MAG: MmcQ/YjbR family DNA-binding protein [Oscillospiraceae bacterium]|nr:MmcQ/YjbR family DNA-binding protein [Oscillospiraceae bacterium]